jgi:glycosyltransferase involved in cell wall biosynthesis
MNCMFLNADSEWSGSARAFAAAARGLAQRGHMITFVAEADSTVERVMADATSGSGAGSVVLEPMSVDRTAIGAARRLAKLARRSMVRVVFVDSDREHLVAAMAYRFGSRARIVRRIPAGRADDVRRSGRLACRLAPTSLMFATERESAVTAAPKHVIARIVAPIGVPEVPAQVESELNGDDVNVVCVHDASSRGRAAAAIRAVAMLAPRHPGLKLVIIGEGIYDDDLTMQAAALGALKLVTSLGDRADQVEVMRTARLGWVVADSDTAAYGILDFMSLGIPVLASDQSIAADYVLSDITGVIVPSDDAYVTAAVAAELLTSDSARKAMGDAARTRVLRENSETAMIDAFERAGDSLYAGAVRTND